MADEVTASRFDAEHPVQTLRETMRTLGEQVFDARLVLCDVAPPRAHITAVHCLAFDGDDVCLALHVTRGWTIPGGHVENDESAEEAMRREALEEAGIAVGSLIVVAYERIQIRGTPPPDFRYPNPGYQVFYVAPLVGMGPITALEECTEARLFPPGEARGLDCWMEDNRALYEAALERASRKI